MSLRQSQSTFLLNACKLIQYATEQGFEVTGGELVRTVEQANLYLKTGFSKAGAKSLHCQRLAIDLNFFKGGSYVTEKSELTMLGTYWESLSPLNSWGGFFSNFEDCPHFSMGVDKSERTRHT